LGLCPGPAMLAPCVAAPPKRGNGVSPAGQGTVSRRTKHAIDLGYLIDEQEKRCQPALLKVGDPLPDEIEVLPRPEVFA
jgi:hypothetical protein